MFVLLCHTGFPLLTTKELIPFSFPGNQTALTAKQAKDTHGNNLYSCEVAVNTANEPQKNASWLEEKQK